MLRAALIFGLVVFATPAVAEGFAAYEGPDAIQEGQGGTKVSKHGVEYWTSGAPYGRFQVLGIYTDERTDKLLAGKAIGSKKIAKKLLELGGHGIIVMNQDSRYGGTNVLVSNLGGGPFATANNFNKISTQIVFVKYLPK